MAINENIITDIQQTIRLEFKKLGQAKNKAEILSESNLLYRSICNDADNFFTPLKEFIEKDEIDELSSCFREYLISFTIGKSQNMALYSFKIVEWFLNSWFLKYGGYGKCKIYAQSKDYSKIEGLITLYDMILDNIDVPLSRLKYDLTKLYYAFDQLELRPIRAERNLKMYLDYDSFAIWKYIRDGYAHGGISRHPFISKRKLSNIPEGFIAVNLAKNERESKYLALSVDDKLSNPVLADFNLFIITNLKFYRDLFKEVLIRK
jgi:hypothetical protein